MARKEFVAVALGIGLVLSVDAFARRHRRGGSNTVAADVTDAATDASETGDAILDAAPVVSDIDQRIALTHIEAGSAYFQVSRYEDALREFQTAYQLAPSSTLQFNLGRTHEALGNFAEAIELYEQYLASGSTDFDPTILRERVNNLRARLAAATSALDAGVNATTPDVVTVPEASVPQPVVYQHSPANAVMPFVFMVTGGLAAAGAIVPGVLALGHIRTVQLAVDNRRWSQEATNAQQAAPTEIALTYALGIGGGVLFATGVIWLAARGKGEPHVVPTATLDPTTGTWLLGAGGRF